MQPLKVPGTLASLKLIRDYVTEACVLASLTNVLATGCAWV